MRSDAKWAVVPHGDIPAWASVFTSPPEGGEEVLEVRVNAGQAQFIVNGVSVQKVTSSAGAFDGIPGIFVSGIGNVAISGVTIERSATMAGGGR